VQSSVPSIMKGATRAARMNIGSNEYHMEQGTRLGTAPENIGLSVQFGRPHTAAMFSESGQFRPGTGPAFGAFSGIKKDFALKSLNTNNGPFRAVSAGFVGNPKLARYEDLTVRLKELLAKEKRNLRVVKTMVATEIETSNKLEKYLRQCVDDVKAEIGKKRNEKKATYGKTFNHLIRLANKPRNGRAESLDDRNLTQLEKDKIIQVLLS
jgi:hypothetical protein